MFNSKSLIIGLLVVFMLGALGACSANKSGDQAGNTSSTEISQPPTQTTPPPTDPPEPVKPSEPVEIVIHSSNGDSEENFNLLYGDPIRKKFQNYTIKYIQSVKGSTLDELLAQQQRVDILFHSIDNFIPLVSSNELQFDMTELAKKHNVDFSRFEDTLIDGIRASGDGELYGLPVSNIVQVMFYNKEIFDKFGIDYPTDGMTWDEAIALAKNITRMDGDEPYFGLSASLSHILGRNQYSQPYVDHQTGQPTFLDDVWKKMVSAYFVDHAQDQVYQNWLLEVKRYPYTGEFRDAQNLAMFVFNSQMVFHDIEKWQSFQWDLVSLPTFSDKPRIGSQSAPVVFGITNIAGNKDAAMEVIDHLTSVEVQMNYSRAAVMPVIGDPQVKEAYAQDSVFADRNWNALFYNELAPLSVKSRHDKIITNYFPGIIKIATGEEDLNTGLRILNDNAIRKINEANQQ